jgi:hypothetical protein
MTAPALKIPSKITGFRVASKEAEKALSTGKAPAAVNALARAVVAMNEKLERPEVLVGSTYKIKTPVSDHAIYLTINDIILNEGTPDEQRRPFEMFINSKNLEQYQWVVALTRIMSAVFRKGGDVTFLVDELKSVFDPKGGYWQKGGVFMPSIIAEMGHVVEKHFKLIGLIKPEPVDEARLQLMAEKRAQYEASIGATNASDKPATNGKATLPGATQCTKCFEVAVVKMDGCEVCVECSASKCG